MTMNSCYRARTGQVEGPCGLSRARTIRQLLPLTLHTVSTQNHHQRQKSWSVGPHIKRPDPTRSVENSVAPR